jgi:SAM-dependent methyltransferase
VKVEIPPRSLPPRLADDPVEYYYRPITSRLYLARLEMAADLLGSDPLGPVLEVGYGAGLFLPELARRSDRVVAVDVHEHDREVGEMLRTMGIDAELRRGSIFELPFSDGEFMAVVSMSVLEHLDQLASAVAELRRVLRPGGFAVLGFPVRNPVTDSFFRLAGYKPRAIHPSSHTDILDAVHAEPRLEVERALHFPRALPMPLSAYVTCRARAVA